MKIEEIEKKLKDIGEYMINNRHKIAIIIADKSTEGALADITETLEGMVGK